MVLQINVYTLYLQVFNFILWTLIVMKLIMPKMNLCVVVLSWQYT